MSKVISPSVIATCHKVIYIALEAFPRLFVVAIPTALMALRGFSLDDISPAFIGASTWVFFGMLSVFYPWDVLTNLNEVYHQKKLPQVVRNEPVLEKMVTFLGDGKSILLHGPTGSGKSAAVRALVELLESEACPPELKNKEIVSLNLEEMLADHNEFLKNLVAVLKVVRLNPHAILYIDEIHRLTQSVHGVKISDTLKLYFEREGTQGKNLFIQAIGITTTEEKDKMMAQEIAFLRRFIPVEMPKTSDAMCLSVIKEHFPSFALSQEVIEKAILVAKEYRPNVALPASAIQVLEMAHAWAKRHSHSADITVEKIQQAIDEGYIVKF